MELARKRVALAPSQIGQWIATPAARWLALLGAGAAYLQGGLDKAFELAGAINELRQFEIAPAAPMAVATSITELVGSALILTGFQALAGRALVCGLQLDGDLHCQPLLGAGDAGRLHVREHVLRASWTRQGFSARRLA
jgi:DoxX